MTDHDRVQFFIKKLYGENIEIKDFKAIGWYSHHYNIIRPDNMELDVFLSMFEKIRNDFPQTTLKTMNNNMYCEITNQDLSTIDKNDLQIVILTSDLYDMEKRVKKLMPKKTAKLPKEKVEAKIC